MAQGYENVSQQGMLLGKIPGMKEVGLAATLGHY